VSVLVVAGVTALAGCGAPAPAPSPAPVAEEQRTTPAAVATGLKNIQGIADQIAAAGTDTAKAQELHARIEPEWAAIEGTVKANGQDTYLAFEDAFAVLEGAAEKADAAAAAQGARSVSTTVAGYLAKFPG
jgi:hypothetical protein